MTLLPLIAFLAIHRIIEKAYLRLAFVWIGILMMEQKTLLARNAIILGIIIIFLIFLFSLTCSGPNDNECDSCNTGDHRTLNTTTNECLCNERYFNVVDV